MKKFAVFFILPLILGVIYTLWIASDQPSSENPFAISFVRKKDLANEDYIAVQEKLRKINLDPLLEQLYVPDQGLDPLADFKRRCIRGVTQVLIDPENGLYPVKKLEKIGNGSDMCIVNCCPYNGEYHKLIQDIPKALQDVGFNGYFYYRIGGFPNPTGKEIRYAGVPYSFKIFMMLEAQQLGFNKVLWIDTSLIPIKDPTPLFAKIEQDGSLISYCHYPERSRIFPKTKEILKSLTNVDICDAKTRHICTQVLGLNMNAEKVNRLIDSYYEFVDMGTPFLSLFPEEFVFASLMEKKSQEWPSTFYIFRLLKYNGMDSIEQAKQEGCYFYLRKH